MKRFLCKSGITTALMVTMVSGGHAQVSAIDSQSMQLTLGESQVLQLPQAVWRRLNLIWVMYSLFMASINAYVAAYFSTEDWVNFKLWGYVFPVVFILGQGLYISRYLPKDEGEQK